MSSTSPNADDSAVDNLIASSVSIKTPQDILELLADGGRRFILKDTQLAAEFFDLSSGFAGEVLQKCSNYGIQVVVVGEYEAGRSTSFQQFARESNRGNNFVFVRSVEEAQMRLAS